VLALYAAYQKDSLLVIDLRLKFSPVNFLRPTTLNGRYFVSRRDLKHCLVFVLYVCYSLVFIMADAERKF
jgi:hypothetical protein